MANNTTKTEHGRRLQGCFPYPAGSKDQLFAHDDHCALTIAQIVARIYQLPLFCLFAMRRGKAEQALARQTAMYLIHVCLGRTYTSVGRFFGRDRTTVAHACRLIEDLRESPEHDLTLNLIEGAIAQLNRMTVDEEGNCNE